MTDERDESCIERIRDCIIKEDYVHAAALAEQLYCWTESPEVKNLCLSCYMHQEYAEGTLFFVNSKLTSALIWLGLALYWLFTNQIHSLGVSDFVYNILSYILLGVAFLSIIFCVVRRMYEKAHIKKCELDIMQALDVCMRRDFSGY